jgi:hypothetical protein
MRMTRNTRKKRKSRPGIKACKKKGKMASKSTSP